MIINRAVFVEDLLQLAYGQAGRLGKLNVRARHFISRKIVIPGEVGGRGRYLIIGWDESYHSASTCRTRRFDSGSTDHDNCQDTTCIDYADTTPRARKSYLTRVGHGHRSEVSPTS